MIRLESSKLEETIRGVHLDLVPQKREHAKEMFALLADSEIHEYTGGYAPASFAEFEARFSRLESRISPDGKERWLNWVVVNRDDYLTGYVQATVRDDKAILAWVTGTGWQRRGYGGEAARLAINWLKDSGCLKFEANISPENYKSRKLARSLGFVESGETQENEDVWILEIKET